MQTESLLTVPQVIDSLGKLMDRNGIPGLMLTLVKDDSLLFAGGLGVKDKAAEAPVDEHTLFRLGSITKSFVALGMLKLVEEGKISLDDEVKKLAPELDFENGFEPNHPVLVKHLLSHTAGFDDMHFNEIFNKTDQPDYPLDKVVQLNKNTIKVRWQPGSRYAYSNPGWSMAGYLIEKVSGMKYDEYITQVILDPIGMEASNFNSVPKGDQYAKGYTDRGKEVPFLPIYHRPAGAFNSSASDIAKFLFFYLNNGSVDSAQVVSPSTIDLMERPLYTLTNRAGLPVGYGIGNYTYDTRIPVQFHGHDGGIDGFVSSYGYSREHRMGFAISNNAGQGMGDMINLLKHFLSQGVAPPSIPVVPLDKEAMAAFEGFYTFKASRNQLFAFMDRLLSSCEVTVDNDTVYLKQFAKDPFAIVPVANPAGDGLLFKGTRDYYPSHIFTKNEDGVAVMATSVVGNYLEKTEYGGVLTKRILFIGSLALLLSSVVAAVVWFIFAMNKALPWPEFFKRAVPSISAAGLLMVVVGVSKTFSDLSGAGEVGVNGLMTYAGTWIILFCAFLSTRFGIMNFKTGQKLPFSVYYIFLAFSCVMMALFLYDAGWMGLKLWEY